MSDTTHPAKQTFPLTSLRFFVAFMVVLHHTAWIALPILSGPGLDGIAKIYLIRVLFLLTFPVSFFFLLSGYVLSMAYLRDDQAVDKRRFFTARFARLYPLYFVMMLLGTPELLAAKIHLHGLVGGFEKTAGVLAGQLLILQGWAPNRVLAIDFPSWSLSSEVLFYASFPVLGVMLWRLRGARLWTAILGFYLGGQALAWAAIPHMNPWVANFWPPLHLSTFVLGILLARWQTLREEHNHGSPPPGWVVNLVFVLSLGGVFISLWMLPYFSELKPYEHGLLSPVLASVIWALSQRTAIFSKILSTTR